MTPTQKQATFIVAVLHDFADAHNVTLTQACNYLLRFGGIRFLIDFYEVEHTLAFAEVLDDIQAICYKNGGKMP